MRKGYKETMSKRTHDDDGKPIYGAPQPPRPKQLSKAERKFIENAIKPINWAENIRTARYGGGMGYVSLECLYDAIKRRLLRDLRVHIDQPPNIDALIPLRDCVQKFVLAPKDES